jgi:ABC-type transporter MlaC component
MNDLFPQSQETFAEHSANENILRSWGNYHYINKEATPEQRKQYEAEFKELIKKR